MRLGMVQPRHDGWYWSTYTNSGVGLLTRSSVDFVLAGDAKSALLAHVNAALAAKESA